MTIQIKAPMVNVNEDEIELVEWHKDKDEFVKKGELLATFESTKSTYEFPAPDTGYFTPLAESGEIVQVGQLIGYFSEQIGASMDEPQETKEHSSPQQNDEIIWTRKAKLLAERHQLSLTDIEQFSQENKITEQTITDFMNQSKPQPTQPVSSGVRMHGIERILILGGGNVAALVIDILTRVPNQTPVAILDDNPELHGTHVLGIPVLGAFDRIDELKNSNLFDSAALAVGVLPARKNLFEQLSAKGIAFTNIIDPTAVIGVNARMGTGNMIMAFCRLGPEAVIGDNNFLSAYVNIEHHNHMGSHCTFGPSVYMSGGVEIGDAVRFGTGIAIEPRLTIGSNAVIASGVTLTMSVPANTVVKARSNFSM